MPEFLVGNAPCSWGTLEFEGPPSPPVNYRQMLDELAETGYQGTELGDWGYMPTDPVRLRQELEQRQLVMLGAFVPVALRDAAAHAEGIRRAVQTARLLAAVASRPAPYLVLSDNNGTVAERTASAGRITARQGLSTADWKTFAAGADAVAQSVRTETGLRTVFHHHCAGYVETPEEIETLLDLTAADHLGLVFDTGHYAYGSGGADAVAGLQRFGDRVWYVHLKDCQPQVAAAARQQGWDYFEALRHGVFCELGQGGVDFPGVLRQLSAGKYDGYLLVEQDVLPGLGQPKESARRNRQYLRSIEHHFTGQI